MELKAVRLCFDWKLIVFAIAVICPTGLRADEVATRPFCGITFITRSETFPRSLIMHIARVDLREPGIAFKLTAPGGTRDTVRQTTLNFLNQERAQLAINAHFYLPFATPDIDANLAGLAASEGIVYSPFEPQPIAAGYVDQSFAIVPFGPGLNIDRFNHATIVHRDPSYPDNKHVLEPVVLWTALSGSAQIVSNGVKTIPTYSGSPGGLNPLNLYSDANSWYNALRARTVIGLTRDNLTLVLFTVDEVGGSAGMTVGETADILMHEYEVYNALNLDGDGSTTIAMEDPVSHSGRIVNNASGTTLARGIGSSLAVFARRLSEGEVRLTITRTATNTIIVSWPKLGTMWDLQQTPTLNPESWRSIGAEPSQVGECAQVLLPVINEDGFYRIIQVGTQTNGVVSVSKQSSLRDKAIKQRRIRTDQKKITGRG